MSEYFKKFKNPQWQKKRLEILDRDKWTCQVCGDKESTLHVHHTCYFGKKDPWDYPEENLITLCEECHSLEHDEMFDLIKARIQILKECGILLTDIADLLDEAAPYATDRERLREFSHCMADKEYQEYLSSTNKKGA